jgi:hypothetical protein
MNLYLRQISQPKIVSGPGPHPFYSLLYSICFWRSRVCWPLFCLCRFFIIFEGYLISASEPECTAGVASGRATKLVIHPSKLANQPSNLCYIIVFRILR